MHFYSKVINLSSLSQKLETFRPLFLKMAARNRANFLISGKLRLSACVSLLLFVHATRGESMMRRKCMQLPRFYIVRIIDSHIAKLNMGNRVN